MYLFLQNYEAKGYFEEPIWDNAPNLASYTHDITKLFHEGELLEAEAAEYEDNYFKLHHSEYGVSMYGSSAYVKIDVEGLLKQGIIREIPEEEGKKIIKFKEAEYVYNIARAKTQECQDFINYFPYLVTQDDLNNLTYLIIKENHAKANMIIAAL